MTILVLEKGALELLFLRRGLNSIVTVVLFRFKHLQFSDRITLKLYR